MSAHNPYTPPIAAVQDAPVPERGSRPAAVVFAVLLLAAGVVWSGIATLRMFAYVNTGFVSPTFLLWALGRIGAYVLACIQLWRGRNWARVLLVVLAAYSLLTLFNQFWSVMHRPAGVPSFLGGTAILLMLVTPASNLVALFLVYLPGRAWFARRA